MLLGLSCFSGLANSKKVEAKDINFRLTSNHKILHIDMSAGVLETLEQELKIKTAKIINIWIQSKKPLYQERHKHRIITTNGNPLTFYTDIKLPSPILKKNDKKNKLVIRFQWEASGVQEINENSELNYDVINCNKKLKQSVKKENISFDIAQTSYVFDKIKI